MLAVAALKTACLNVAEWALLDASVMKLFASPDLEATLEVLGETLVPRYADAIILALADWRDVVRIVAVHDSDADRRRALTLHLHEVDGPTSPSTITNALPGAQIFPLKRAGIEFGRIYLYNAIASPLLDLLLERCEQALFNARRFEHERYVAFAFQNAALASELPRCAPFQFSAIYEAGRAEALVGGDWYDAFKLADGRFVIAIGDVEGSGLDAALAMVSLRQTVRAVAQLDPDPELMLASANRTLQAQFPGRYATAFVGVLDPVTQRCTYASAGHPPPLVRLADGSIHTAASHGCLLGLPLDTAMMIDEIDIPAGAVMVLYTDGLTESTRDVLAGEQRLENVLRELDPQRTQNIAEYIYANVVGGHARDDIAILALRVGSLPALPQWRFDPRWPDVTQRIRGSFRAELPGGLAVERFLDVEMVLSELFANSLRHAPGTIEVIVEKRPGAFVLHVLDRGPRYAVDARLPDDLFSESGRGLFLISQLSDDFVVVRRPGGGNHARITFMDTKETTR
jgi:anti-sigma regulatory factor (Ser/Thr protein kinase)